MGLWISAEGIAYWQCSYCSAILHWVDYLEGLPADQRPQADEQGVQRTCVTLGESYTDIVTP
eukprot:15146046-Heterocapsa_arctica.AAC.1